MDPLYNTILFLELKKKEKLIKYIKKTK